MLSENKFRRLEELLVIRKSNSFNSIPSRIPKRNLNLQNDQVKILRPINLSLQKNSNGFYLKKDTYTEIKLPNISIKKNYNVGKKTKLREIEKEFWLDTFKTQKIKSYLPNIKPFCYQNDPYQEYRKLIKERNLVLINETDKKYETLMKIF